MRYQSPKRNKYGVRVDAKGKLDRTRDGVLFDSKGEAKHYENLKWREELGLIRDLEIKKRKFNLKVNNKLIATIKPDFSYINIEDNPENKRVTLDDFKGKMTRDFAIKWRLLDALYGDEYDLVLTRK